MSCADLLLIDRIRILYRASALATGRCDIGSTCMVVAGGVARSMAKPALPHFRLPGCAA
jgi:hypothetical protein